MLSEATPLKEELYMTITDYIIVLAVNPGDLARKVREKITEGYQPFGNMVFTTNGYYHQPMVKYA